MDTQNLADLYELPALDWSSVTNRLAAEPFYTNLFAATFGTPGVDEPCVQAGLDKVADQLK